jgi:hypothetical protein
MSTSSSREVQLVIYDLSMGMARNLSAQFLGPQHAIEIIPHTAIIAFGKEYFFGQGIDWCSPAEFRASRGIHPIDIQSLGYTNVTEQEFESWCHAQTASGRFGPESYDLFLNNCNNFSDEAARYGLRLQRGTPQWILDVPQKVLSSPMGAMLRPMMEQMQVTRNAPTNLPARVVSQSSFAPSISSSAMASTNPWANIPAATSAPSTQPSSHAKQTQLLHKLTALLSTDTGVIKICVDRLQPNQEHNDLISKLSNISAKWTQEEIVSLHKYLCSVINDDASKNTSYALMLLRLVVLKRTNGDDDVGVIEAKNDSVQLVAKLLLEAKLSSNSLISMAWCVLSNAIGSSVPPDWTAFTGVVDRALYDCGSSKDGKSTSLRQSAAAFLYNASLYLTLRVDRNGDIDTTCVELSEDHMSILLGCLEQLQDESDVTTLQRLLMATGSFLKSPKLGKIAANLVNELGLLDESLATGKSAEVDLWVKEVVGLVRIYSTS